MTRPVLPWVRIHPAAQPALLTFHKDTLDQVSHAVDTQDVVVVGMAQNPWCARARRTLQAKGVAHTYLEYGSYLSQWRRRLALKMWTGWPTFPMVFVKGMLVGGAQDLQRLVDSGGFDALLNSSRHTPSSHPSAHA